MMDFETVNIPGYTEHTDDTEPTGSDRPPSAAPFEPEPRERTRDLARMERQLTELYANIGTYGGMMTGQKGMLAGGVIAGNAASLAEAWIDLAERDQGVRRAIQRVLESGGWAGVIGAHVVTILPIAALAGVLPANMAQQVFRGLAVANPELYAWLAMQTGNTPTPPPENGNVN